MRTIRCEKGEIRLPCLDVRIVPIGMVRANDYNPNEVSSRNMELLETSIMCNGFCFPVVTIWDPSLEQYVIIDGFHRYRIFLDLGAEEIPIIVLEHDVTKRMEATVQFNRARGVHQVELMGDLVIALIRQGVGEEEIAGKLGMELEEVLRLKQVTGIAEVFKNQSYSSAWEMVETEGEGTDGLELR